MKLRIKDRRMKERVVGVKSILDKEEDYLDFYSLFDRCDVCQVIIEPIYGGIFYEV